MPTALDSAEHNMITAARPVTSSSTSAGDPTPYDVLLAGIAASAHARETLTPRDATSALQQAHRSG